MERLIVIALLLFNLIFSGPSNVYSQVNFFPTGAEWIYGFSGGFTQTSGYTHYVYSGDTIIESWPSKIINRTTYYFDYINPTIPIDTVIGDPFYMAQSGNSIFFYNTYDTLFQLLWKQDVQAGDMFEIPDYFLPFTMTIDSVQLQMYNSLEVKKIWISGDTGFGQSGNDIIYDRFGPVGGFFYYSCWGFFDCYSAKLCRYKSDEMGQVDFSGYACDLLTTGIKPVAAPTILVYPNPFDETFTIDLPNDATGDIYIKLYTVMGQQVNSKISRSGNSLTIQPETTSDAIYFCMIEYKGKREVIKVIAVR